MVPACISIVPYGREAFTFYLLNETKKRKIAETWDLLVISSGILFTFVAWVQMAGNMKDMRVLAPTLSVSILTIAYAYAFRTFVLIPLSKRPWKSKDAKNKETV